MGASVFSFRRVPTFVRSDPLVAEEVLGETIADNLSKAGWSWPAFRPWTVRGEQSGLLTHIASMGSVSSYVGIKKLTAFVELGCSLTRFQPRYPLLYEKIPVLAGCANA